ncbi:hypothetical protein [Lacticaseibacillus saniviri]|uniref:hypothetical protein n=1 Tax=Lacticaseibacillus saniviri TaxID=931533 RepID=UPI0012E11DA5|nr:hypothetical protein [Lacticaseibacillus saniviri]
MDYWGHRSCGDVEPDYFIYLSGTFDKADREIQRKQAQIEREFEERAKKSKDWLNFKTKDKKKD